MTQRWNAPRRDVEWSGTNLSSRRAAGYTLSPPCCAGTPAGDQPEHWQAAVLFNLDSDGCLSEVPGTPCALQSSTLCWRSLLPLHVGAVVLYFVVFVSAGIFFAPACRLVVLVVVGD